MPALWQVQMVKPTLFSNFLWDGCEKHSRETDSFPATVFVKWF
jgi:hypothetical protein